MSDAASPMQQTVLVIGGAGFIGNRLARRLACMPEFRPIAAVRRPTPDLVASGVEVRPCDATDARALQRALFGADLVVNCVSGSDRVLIGATRNLFAAARRMPPRRIVHLSSTEVYGEASGVLAEDAPLTAPATHYGNAKRECERVVADYAREGSEAVVLRPSCVHGPGSVLWTERLARLLRAGRLGDLGENGRGPCNLAYIDDLIDVILATLRAPALGGETFNVTDAAELTWNEFLTRLAEAIGVGPARPISRGQMQIETKLAGPALVAARRLSRQGRFGAGRVPDAITPSMARLFRRELRFSPAKADRWLKIKRTPLQTALDESARWLSAAQAASRPGSVPDGFAAVRAGRRCRDRARAAPVRRPPQRGSARGRRRAAERGSAIAVCRRGRRPCPSQPG
jgi:nucleoside-diphosphate-sugar epimerase